MQIILVHPRLRKARTITVGLRHLVAAGAAALIAVAAIVIGTVWALGHFGTAFSLPSVSLNAADADATRQNRYLRENLNAMAVKLGEMQAQLMRLEALGDRVSGLAGIKPQDFNFKNPPPQGGAEPAPGSTRELSMTELKAQLDQLATDIDRRSDFFNVAESQLMESTLKSKMMPTIQPVNVLYNSSGFGWRIDPFNGRMAMHEGIDFVAQPGTPIVAAAGGVVITSEWHHDFGNMVEIDHGNGITTLYAHSSRVYVHVGDIVRRNQHIADVGSTGRATGPHLHFEVHVRGIPQNPAKFLTAGSTAIAAAGH